MNFSKKMLSRALEGAVLLHYWQLVQSSLKIVLPRDMPRTPAPMS
jgi:hypothetical protein